MGLGRDAGNLDFGVPLTVALTLHVVLTTTEFDDPDLLTLVEITDEDRDIIGRALDDVSFPAWAEVCDAQNETCSADWKETVGAAMSQ